MARAKIVCLVVEATRREVRLPHLALAEGAEGWQATFEATGLSFTAEGSTRDAALKALVTAVRDDLARSRQP